MERGDVDLPSEQTADVGTDAAQDPRNPAQTPLPDYLLAAAVDDAVIGDVLAGLPEAQPERSLQSATDFSSLYIRHRSGLAAHARRYLRDPRDVDEVVQETFLRLFLAISEIETELQAIAFARRTLTNLCIDRYRADRRRPTLITLDASPFFDLTGGDEDPDPVLQAEDAAIVRDALARLTPLHRAALVKREIEEKSLPQIASELGVAEESVKHLLFRARRALRRLLVGTSVQPGIDLTGTDGVPRQPNPLVRGAGVFIIFLVGALVVSPGIRPLFSGGGPARTATEAVGAPQLDFTGPDALAPKGLHPKPAPHRHRHASSSTPSDGVSSTSSDSAPDVTLGLPTPPAKHQPPVRTLASRGHFHLNGPLKVTSAPHIVPGGTIADQDGSGLSASSFSASTDHGRFDLNQSVSRSSDGATTVAVTPSFVVGGMVEQPEITGSAAAVGADASGNVMVDVAVETRSDPSAGFALSSLTAHFELSPDLAEVLNETVTLTAGASDAGSLSVGNAPSSGTKPPPTGSKPPPSATPPPDPAPGSTSPDPSPPDSAPSCSAPGAAPAADGAAMCPPADTPGADTGAADPATSIRE